MNFDISLDVVPTNLTIAQIFRLFTYYGEGREEDWDVVRAYTRSHHIYKVGDLWLEDGEWKEEELMHGQRRISRSSSPSILKVHF